MVSDDGADLFSVDVDVVVHLYGYGCSSAATAEANARRVNPHLTIFRVSATTGDGIAAWLDWIRAGLAAQHAKRHDHVDALKARIAELERQLAAR